MLDFQAHAFFHFWMSQKLLSLAALGLLLSVSASADIHVDNDSGAPGYTETGSWTTTANVGAGYNGGSYRYTQFTSPPSTAVWRPTITAPGYYETWAIFRRGSDRTSNAPYTITHADGVSTASVDQTGPFSGELGNGFLGSYRLEAGDAATVTLRNNGGTGVYIADTILFRPDPGPAITGLRRAPLYPQADGPFAALAVVTDGGGVQGAEVHWAASPSGMTGIATAADDGLRMDGKAGDGLYGALLPGFPAGETVTFHFRATDNVGTQTTSTATDVTIGVSASFDLRVNEIVASNAGSSLDLDFGESGDWVELVNIGPDTADLTSMTLSDSQGNPTKWSFPPGTTLPAGDYLLVYCDNYDVAENDLHTNFALSAGGEAVVLYDTRTASVVDQIVFPALGSDEAYARIPDGTGAFENTIITTPLAPNQAGQRGAAPVFSVPSGLYATPFAVSITAPGATEIRYTTDGREPTAASPLYTAPLPVSATSGIRAKAWYPAPLNPSLPATASYLFDAVANRTIPVLNIIMDPDDLFSTATGIYANFSERGENWERPAYAVFMNPDGSQVTESGVGIRINGGTSRSAAKKSFRLHLRNSYGRSSWNLPWLSRTTAAGFNNLVLRANNNDGIVNQLSSQINQVTFFRDQAMRHWHEDSGALGVDGFFCALYLNGQYWGLYNPCERVTDDYMAAKVGGADWDVVKGTWNSTVKYHTEVLDGDLTAWNAFLAWLDGSDLSTPEGLAQLKGRIDYRGFLKYFALNIIGQNEDWPQNNWIATRARGNAAARWMFHENDAEWALGIRPQGYVSDTIVWAQGQNFMLSPSHNGTIAPLSKLFNGNNLDPNRTSDVNGILDNPEGRRDFISAVEEILNFEFSPAVSIPKVDAYAALIQTEVPRESARWSANMIISASAFNASWPVAVNTMRTFLTNRPAHVRSLMASKFGIAGTRVITFQKSGTGDGRLQVYGRLVDLPWTGTFFDSSTLELAAIADAASQFSGWSGDITSAPAAISHNVVAGGQQTVTLDFSPYTVTDTPNSVIINEYWVNDNGTAYPMVPGGIQGSWIELLVVKPSTDLRGWRLTNNPTLATKGTSEDGDGSLIFPNHPGLSALPAGTIVLVVPVVNATNTASFPQDDVEASDRRIILYRGNGNLDAATDPGFAIGTSNAAITLLAPGPTDSFADDIGIDFIAEGSSITPASFFGAASPPVAFPNPFSGIGGDDGAFFTNDPLGGFDNDDGTDTNTNDALPGPGGWVVDPPAAFSGDAAGTNVLTPGGPNTGQDLQPLINASVADWQLL